jgi:hypothetical protein
MVRPESFRTEPGSIPGTGSKANIILFAILAFQEVWGRKGRWVVFE